MTSQWQCLRVLVFAFHCGWGLAIMFLTSAESSGKSEVQNTALTEY